MTIYGKDDHFKASTYRLEHQGREIGLGEEADWAVSAAPNKGMLA